MTAQTNTHKKLCTCQQFYNQVNQIRIADFINRVVGARRWWGERKYHWVWFQSYISSLRLTKNRPNSVVMKLDVEGRWVSIIIGTFNFFNMSDFFITIIINTVFRVGGDTGPCHVRRLAIHQPPARWLDQVGSKLSLFSSLIEILICPGIVGPTRPLWSNFLEQWKCSATFLKSVAWSALQR